MNKKISLLLAEDDENLGQLLFTFLKTKVEPFLMITGLIQLVAKITRGFTP